MLGEVADDFLPGRGGEAGDRGGHAGEVLADEACDVEVVGAEVLTPARQAVRLVEHPGGDLSQAQGLGEGAVAELFGGDQDDAGFAQANLVEGRAPLGRREHAVEGDRALDALPDEVVDLVLHQRLQRRDDDGELAGARVVRQCRHLVADRLAAPGGQDGQQAGLVEAGNHDLALQRSAPGAGGHGPEAGQPEMLLQQGFGVVVPGAVAAVSVVTTVECSEFVDEGAGLGPGGAHPVGQGRGAGGHPQPAQCLRQRPALVEWCGEQSLHHGHQAGGAADVSQQAGHHAGPAWMLEVQLAQGLDLFIEEVQAHPCVAQGVVAGVRDDLVVLEEAVRGLLGERPGSTAPAELIDDLGGLRDRGGVEVGEQPLRVVAAQGTELEDPVVLGRQSLDVDAQDGQA